MLMLSTRLGNTPRKCLALTGKPVITMALFILADGIVAMDVIITMMLSLHLILSLQLMLSSFLQCAPTHSHCHAQILPSHPLTVST